MIVKSDLHIVRSAEECRNPFAIRHLNPNSDYFLNENNDEKIVVLIQRNEWILLPGRNIVSRL